MTKRIVNTNRVAALVALVIVICAVVPFQANAQTPMPATSDASQSTATLIIKFRDTSTTQVLDTQATTRAAKAANIAMAKIAPMHMLSALAMNELVATAGVTLTHVREMSGQAHVLRLPSALPMAQVQAIAERLSQLGSVEYAVPSQHVRALSIPANKMVADVDVTPNDPLYAQQWHYAAPVSGTMGANLPSAWSITTGSTGIVVAVVDTGARYDHPDLAGRLLPGYDFITDVKTANDGDGRDADATDPGDWTVAADGCSPGTSSWHGTHVAGTIGAATNNGIGVTGINWVSKILPVRVLGKCGNDDPDVIDGLRWAAGLSVPGVPANPTPARVLNMSLGGDGVCNTAWKNAINEIYAKGVVIVVAAGNEAATSANNQTPGGCPNALTVSATNRNGSRASYSSWGSSVELSAPGGETHPTLGNGVLSTLDSGTTVPVTGSYEFYAGTSMATPHVAGIVSLMLSANPYLGPAEVQRILQSTATAFPNNGGTCDANTAHTCGTGIVNAGAAVAAAMTYKQVFLPTAIQQPTTSCGGDSPKNGGFELGSGVGWMVTSTAHPTDPLIYDQASGLPGVTPHCGSYTAWLGGNSGLSENATLRQSATVSVTTPYLVYYQIIDSSETNCSTDFARVLVNNAPVAASQTGICSTASTALKWQRKSLNLSSYVGQTVTLDFNFQADASVQDTASSWVLDDIAFSATP